MPNEHFHITVHSLPVLKSKCCKSVPSGIYSCRQNIPEEISIFVMHSVFKSYRSSQTVAYQKKIQDCLCVHKAAFRCQIWKTSSLLIPAVKLTQILPAHKNKEKKSSFSKNYWKKNKEKLQVKYRTVCHISQVFCFFCYILFF